MRSSGIIALLALPTLVGVPIEKPSQTSVLHVKGRQSSQPQKCRCDHTPRDSLVVFTGCLVPESLRSRLTRFLLKVKARYVESFSAYARQFLGQVDRPDVDVIDGSQPRRVD
jgi:excinuclease UvrABC ATPase subunit